MKRTATVLLALLAFAACARSAQTTDNTLAHGARDGDVLAWTVGVDAPAGWTRDCCTYARAIGVNAVLYQGDWSGKPQRVIVLNVSPRKLPTLADELQADRKRYRQLDPAVKISPLLLRHRDMPCAGTTYAGSDHVDDVVVFCDPGKASGVRLSWSMSFDGADAHRRPLLDDFMRVVLGASFRSDPAPVRAAPATRD